MRHSRIASTATSRSSSLGTLISFVARQVSKAVILSGSRGHMTALVSVALFGSFPYTFTLQAFQFASGVSTALTRKERDSPPSPGSTPARAQQGRPSLLRKIHRIGPAPPRSPSTACPDDRPRRRLRGRGWRAQGRRGGGGAAYRYRNRKKGMQERRSSRGLRRLSTGGRIGRQPTACEEAGRRSSHLSTRIQST